MSTLKKYQIQEYKLWLCSNLFGKEHLNAKPLKIKPQNNKFKKCIQPYILIKNTRPITCILDVDRLNIERLSEIFSHLLCISTV